MGSIGEPSLDRGTNTRSRGVPRSRDCIPQRREYKEIGERGREPRARPRAGARHTPDPHRSGTAALPCPFAQIGNLRVQILDREDSLMRSRFALRSQRAALLCKDGDARRHRGRRRRRGQADGLTPRSVRLLCGRGPPSLVGPAGSRSRARTEWRPSRKSRSSPLTRSFVRSWRLGLARDACDWVSRPSATAAVDPLLLGGDKSGDEPGDAFPFLLCDLGERLVLERVAELRFAHPEVRGSSGEHLEALRVPVPEPGPDDLRPGRTRAGARPNRSAPSAPSPAPL